ncbi:P-loop containing nucleoside triphosphate hydrolase protein [Sparassis latifolia]
MAKKKKTQLKAVARGFATTSVPKKVVLPAEEDGVDISETIDAAPIVKDAIRTTPVGGELAQAPTDDYDLDKHEEESLQLLVDKLQDKTEKDIVRTIKAIKQEQRFSETLVRLDWDSRLVDRVLSLALESDHAGVKRALDETEEKAIARLAITYGVLRRLGFSEDRVEECLRATEGVDLDEAFAWLHLHCAEEELGLQNAASEPKTPTINTPQSPRTSLTPVLPSSVSGYSSHGVSSSSRRLNPDISVFEPTTSASLTSLHYDDGMPEETDIGGTHTPLFSDHGRQSPTDDANAEFIRLKLQISDLTTHRRQPDETRDAAFLRGLQKRLEDVKKDYFFDQEEAEAQFRIEREKADAAALRSRLRGEVPVVQTLLSLERCRNRPPEKEPPPSVVWDTSSDIFDNEDEESNGGLFELLEAMPETEVSDRGVTVAVRDMALPKHWSGRTPRSLLSEVVHKVDRFAAISYQCISGPSRTKRAAVEIHWEGGKTQGWSMDDIACHDMSQAEQYISTIAMHALTFPRSDGFASVGSMGVSSQTTFRLLPAIYRDLWDELEQKRKVTNDAVNRSVWAKLKVIVEPKMNVDRKANSKVSRDVFDRKDSPVIPNIGQSNDLTSEQIKAGFRTRQASAPYQDMLRQREQLPIARYRGEITSILDRSQILVLSGETGCGKSTQVPAFILEHQLALGRDCKIYCTEPRRISAISLAQRVSRELGEVPGAVGTLGSIVGYSIRLESNITSRTRLAFVTNGIALRMLEGGSGQGGQGTAFDEITHIIIDEVHERTIESDFLLIVLKSLLRERPNLKVVLMSATVDADKISDYFGGCPILYVPGRTFPVDVRYLEDAVEFTRWKITESSPYARRGKDKFNQSKAKVDWSEDTAPADDEDEEAEQDNVKLEKRYSPNTVSTVNLLDERVIPYDLIVRLLERLCIEDPTYTTYSAAILIFMPGMGEIRRLNDILSEHRYFGSELQFKLYPLHSMISSENQGAVFDIPPQGIRKIVIATNIAETGITIPDITCVIDTGKHREMRFDEKRQISRLIETFVAKSNAAQRRGRAGRVQSGLCFHLFTKLRHDTKLAQHPDPEMMRLSLSDLALRIKIMKVKLGSSVEDVLSRALDPPLPVNIQRAVSSLVEVRALTLNEEITPMGRLLSKLPTDVHLGKFLLIATLFRCLDPALTVAATLNSKSPFLSPLGLEKEADRAKLSFQVENSDFLTLHNAFASWRRACANGVARKFCKSTYLSHQNLQQIEELRQQFLGYLVDSSFIQVDKAFVLELSRARFTRNRTRFVAVPAELDLNSSNVFLFNAALTAGLYPKILAVDPMQGGMRTITNNQAAFFHPSSVNFRRKPKDFGVNHLCYFTLMHSKKLYAWETGPVDDISLLLLCGEAEFKLASDVVYIDRKIKFRITPKSGIALKVLRAQISSLLATQMRSKPLLESQVLWNDLAMMVLGKFKVNDPLENQDGVTVVIHNRNT